MTIEFPDARSRKHSPRSSRERRRPDRGARHREWADGQRHFVTALGGSISVYRVE